MGRLRRDGDDSTWRARMRRGLARSQVRGHEVRAEPQYADGHPACRVRFKFEIRSLAALFDFEFIYLMKRAFIVHMEEYTW